MEVRYKAEAIKELKKIGNKDKPKVKKKIELLTKNPLVGKQLVGKFKGLYSLHAWPLRVIYRWLRKTSAYQAEDERSTKDIFSLARNLRPFRPGRFHSYDEKRQVVTIETIGYRSDVYE